MKWNPLPLWNVRIGLLLCLCVAGCSGKTSEQPAVAHGSSVPLVPAPRQQQSVDEVPLAMKERAMAPAENPLEGSTPETQLPPLEGPAAAPADEQPTTDSTPSGLAWDYQEQRQVVSEDEGPVLFSFRMTNIFPETITIEKINISCGCTTVDARSLPFSLEPGASENVQISMTVTGKFGTVTKSVLVQTSCGSSTLLVTSEVTPATDEVFVDGLPNGAAMSAGSRGKNISLAEADRQAVFKGSCAECHSQYAKEQFGYNLYLGACAICHDAKHRASMVPDLRTFEIPRDAAHWREHITNGIDGTLMPAFATEKGGILSDQQIESLVKFLVETPASCSEAPVTVTSPVRSSPRKRNKRLKETTMRLFRRLIAICCLMGIAPYVAAAEPVKVGILGLDNYQAIEYAAFFNNPMAEGDLAGLRVTAVYPATSPDYPMSAEFTAKWQEQLLARYKEDPTVRPIELVSSIDELLLKCDVVMIFSLDGRKHREQATAVINAGKPLFIGRPVASEPEDTVAIYQLAADAKVPLWSCSQHRYSPGFIGMRNHPEVGTVLGCDVYGGFAKEGPEADEFTRALHSIETLYTIMGPGVERLSCVSMPAVEVVTATYKDGRVATYRGVKEGAVKYSATVFGDKGVSTAGIYGHGIPINGVVPTSDAYMGYGGLAIELAKFFKTKEVPVAPAETLEIFAFLQAMKESRAQNGAVVTLKKL